MMKAYLCVLLFVSACGARTGLLDGTTQSSKSDAIVSDTPSVLLLSDARDTSTLSDSISIGPKSDCIDSTTMYIYLLTIGGEVLSFNPGTLQSKSLGQLRCPGEFSETWSMAVNRKGIAYVLFNSGRLFQVALSNLSCTATSYSIDALDFPKFGMGFATDQNGPSETLYVSASGYDGSFYTGLGSIDLKTFQLKKIGAFDTTRAGVELTGTGDGRLYGFAPGGLPPWGQGIWLMEIDKQTGKFLSEKKLAQLDAGYGWAFGFWGGDFWFFTNPTRQSSQVTRYRPSDQSLTKMTTFSTRIVGAGVSTCAPEAQ